MEGAQIFGVIMMCFGGFGCGALYFWIGHWAESRKDPMHFYTGTTVDPKTITDVPAYNRENAKMWKQFSVPFWLCGLCAFGSIWLESLMTVSIIMIVLACTVGIGWLVWKYNRILKTYQFR